MSAFKDLLSSERGVIALLLIIAITVLASLGQVTFADWKEYTLYIFGIFVAGNTATSVTRMVTDRPAAPAAGPVVTNTIEAKAS